MVRGAKNGGRIHDKLAPEIAKSRVVVFSAVRFDRKFEWSVNERWGGVVIPSAFSESRMVYQSAVSAFMRFKFKGRGDHTGTMEDE